MNTTEINQAEIGMPLTKDKEAFNQTMAIARKVLPPPFEAVKKAYENLGLSRPFSQALLNEMLQDGLSAIEKEFSAMTEEDLKGFRSPVVLAQMRTQAEEYLKPLRDAYKAISQALHDCYDKTGYKSSADEITYANGQFAINSEGVEEFYTKRITTQTQVDALNKLYEIEAAYNELAGILKSTSMHTPGMFGTVAPLMQRFFHQKATETESGSVLTLDEIKVVKGAIAYIKNH